MSSSNLRISLQLNQSAAEEFLSIIFPGRTEVLIRTLQDKKDETGKPFPRSWYDSLEISWPLINEAQVRGAGAFYLVGNTSNGRGKKDDITGVPVYWFDDDKYRTKPRSDWPIDPTVIVATSPGKYHYYWALEEEETDFERFLAVMRQFVKMGHDKNACKITQILRLPGTYHQKKEPFMVRMVQKVGRRYTIDEVVTAFIPDTDDDEPDTLKMVLPHCQAPDPKWTYEKVEQVIPYIPQQYVDDRETWLRIAMALKHQFGDEGLKLFDLVSSRSVFYDYDELLETWQSLDQQGIGKTTIGTLLYYAQKNPNFDAKKLWPVDEDQRDNDDQGDFLTNLVRFKDATFDPKNNGLVKGVFERGDVSSICGQPGAGKSFFAADIALAVARGEPYVDRRTVKTGVLYVALEGARGFRNRLAAYRKQFRPDDDIPFFLLPVSIDLHGSSIDVEKIIRTIDKLAEEGASIGLIVIDTLAQSMGGGDENSSNDMGAVLKNVEALRDQTQAHICLVHHLGKDASKGLRGHSSLKGALDTVVEVTAVADVKLATVTKQKDGENGQLFPFRLQKVSLGFDEDNDEVSSCVVEHVKLDRSTVTLSNMPMQAQRTYQLIYRKNAENEGLDDGVPIGLTIEGISLAFFEAGITTSESKDGKRKAFKRALDNLQEANLIDMDDTHVWLVSRQEAQEYAEAA